jgi:hypothetical protein
MKRKNGYYRIKILNHLDWTIGLWSNGKWHLFDHEINLTDDYLSEINEIPINISENSILPSHEEMIDEMNKNHDGDDSYMIGFADCYYWIKNFKKINYGKKRWLL